MAEYPTSGCTPAAFRWTIPNTFWTNSGAGAATTTPSASPSSTAAPPPPTLKALPQFTQFTPTGWPTSLGSDPTLACQATGRPFPRVWTESSTRGWTWITSTTSESSEDLRARRATSTSTTTTWRGWNEKCSLCNLPCNLRWRRRLLPLSRPRLPVRPQCQSDRRWPLSTNSSSSSNNLRSLSSFCHLRPRNTKRLYDDNVTQHKKNTKYKKLKVHCFNFANKLNCDYRRHKRKYNHKVVKKTAVTRMPFIFLSCDTKILKYLIVQHFKFNVLKIFNCIFFFQDTDRKQN